MNCKNCEYGLKQSCGDFEKIICTYEEGECVKIAELEYQLTHRNCVDCSNHSSKLRMRTLELEKENVELREQHYADCTLVEQSFKIISEAKGIIKNLLRGANPRMEKEAEDFIKE